MRVLLRAMVIGLLLLPLLSTGSEAQQTRDAEIQDIKRRLEQIEAEKNQEIQELRERLDELEAQKATDQQMIEELKAKKAEEEKGDSWIDNLEVKYKKPGDGITIKSKDGNFSIRTRLRTQVQFSVFDEDDGDTATNFDIRRLRITWDGYAFRPWFFYTIQIDPTDDIILRDAYFDAAYNTLVAPRGGQYKVPFSREQLNSSSELQLVERSILDDEFGFGRDQGAGVYGVFGDYLAYGVGVFNGDGRNGTSVDSNLLYVGRVMFFPCCGELEYKPSSFVSGGDYEIDPNFGGDTPLIAIGLAVAGIPGLEIANKTPDNDIDVRFEEIFGLSADAITEDADVITFTADANFKYKIVSLEGDYFLRRIDPDGGFDSITDHGFRIQGGVFIIPEFIEVAGRFAYIAFDDDVIGSRDSAFEITPGLNVYLSKSHKWKLQFSFSRLTTEDTDGTEVDDNVFRTQLQAYF